MIEILRHGEKYFQAKCQFCKAEFGFLEKDMKRKTNGTDDYFGEIHTYIEKYIACPECDKKLYVLKNLDGADILEDKYKLCLID